MCGFVDPVWVECWVCFHRELYRVFFQNTQIAEPRRSPLGGHLVPFKDSKNPFNPQNQPFVENAKKTFLNRLQPAEFATMPSRQFNLHAIGHSQDHEAAFDVFHIGDMVEVDSMASAG